MENKDKKKRTRSPNFPGVSLRVAVEKTDELYREIGTHQMHLTTAAKTWKYSIKSSGLTKLVGALGAYGLIEIEGSKDARRIQVSKDGERIVEKAPGHESLLQKAAIRPKLFEKIMTKHSQKGQLPPDDVLRENLRWDDEIAFNKETIDRFIANLKDTIAYSKLELGDIIELKPDEITPDSAENEKDLKAGGQINEPNIGAQIGTYQTGNLNMKQYTIPLGGGEDAVLSIPQPITEQMCKQIKKFIDYFLMEPMEPDEPPHEKIESEDSSLEE